MSKKIEIPNEVLRAIKDKIYLLMEAAEADNDPDAQVCFKTMAVVGSFDPHPGGSFQIVVELRTNERDFLKDGDIVILTEEDRQRIPYKTIRAKDDRASNNM